MLKSKDSSLLTNSLSLDNSRFLDESVATIGHKIGFCSFPRCGNSFMRKLLELCTGIVTGSCMSLHTAVGLQV